MWFKTDMCWSTLLNTSVESGTQILRQRYIMDLFLVWDGLFFFFFLYCLKQKEYFRAVLNTLKSVTSMKKFWYLLNNSVEFFGNNYFIEKY